MSNTKVVEICIGPAKGAPMVNVQSVKAIAGAGLEGDRYTTGNGSFNKGEPGKRQVTLMNAIFFQKNIFMKLFAPLLRPWVFDFVDSRRNILVDGTELMWLIGREFQIGHARMKGVKYADPCGRPTTCANKRRSFKKAFFDRGGIIAEILESGTINVGSSVVPPVKGY